MTSKHNQGFLANLKYDIPASIIVFLVAVPLCLGIALASGAPLFSGIIAGIVGGLVVAPISGSPLGVSGPAAGLAVIVLTTIQDLGSFENFLLAVVLAGIIQLVLGILKAGVIGYYFPSSVISGMLSGIGIIIILKQIPHAFGYDKDPEGDFRFFQTDGHTTFSEFAYMLDSITPGALIIAILSLVILILWEQPFMKKISLFTIIQGPLVVVVGGILLNIVFQSYADLTISSEHTVNIPVASSIGDFFTQFTLPNFSLITSPKIYIAAATIAIVASLETLLCVEATDKLDPQKRITPTNRELIAQGVGNIISGTIGGLPITQVIVRSSANIQSGGKTKTSAFFHGLLILGCVMLIPTVLNLVPLASLAAILLLVGYKLAKPSIFKKMFDKGKSEFIPFTITILGIVFTDLLIGIGLGLVVAIFHILWNNYKTPYYFDQEEYEKGNPIRIELAENVTFLHKASVLRTLNQVPDETEVIIDVSKSKSIHPDVYEIIHDFERNAETRDIKITFEGIVQSKDENVVKEFGATMAK